MKLFLIIIFSLIFQCFTESETDDKIKAALDELEK